MRHLISQHSSPFLLTTFKKTVLIQICELAALLDFSFFTIMSKSHSMSLNKMCAIRLNCFILIVSFFTDTAFFALAPLQSLINTTNYLSDPAICYCYLNSADLKLYDGKLSLLNSMLVSSSFIFLWTCPIFPHGTLLVFFVPETLSTIFSFWAL